MIINISGDISLVEANEAASFVQELAGDDANIIFGAMYDENAQDEATITVIATGLDGRAPAAAQGAPVAGAMAGFNSYRQKPQPAQAEVAATAQNTAQGGFNPGRPAPVSPTPLRPIQGGAGPQSMHPAGGTGQQPGGQVPPQTGAPYRPNVNVKDITIPDFLRNKR